MQGQAGVRRRPKAGQDEVLANPAAIIAARALIAWPSCEKRRVARGKANPRRVRNPFGGGLPIKNVTEESWGAQRSRLDRPAIEARCATDGKPKSCATGCAGTAFSCALTHAVICK
jgi:hypothetical protein